MRAVLSRVNPARSDDRGSTLVTVIGISIVIAIFASLLVTSVVFAIGQTTASRSSVSAKSASEAGLESAAAAVSSGACWVGGTGSGTSPVFAAQVQRLVSSTANPALASSWTNGCPTAAPVGGVPTPFRVISTGRSGSPGSGNASGDKRTMVAQFTVIQRPGTPEFNQAIFGDVQTNVNTNITLTAAAGGGDILTDHFDCSSNMNSVGGVRINSSLAETSKLNTTCKLAGDLITKGNLECPADGLVGGDVVAAGNVKWNTTCRVEGDMIVGGNFDCPTAGATVVGDLTVVGNVSIASTCNLQGNIYVGGTLKISNTLSYPKNIWVRGNIEGNGGLTLTAGGSVRVRGALTGGLTSAKVFAPTKVIPDVSLPAPTAPNMATWFPPGDPSLEFPKISKADARWNGWVQRSWVQDLRALKAGPYLAPECDQSYGTANFTGPLVVATPTIYDLTAAPLPNASSPTNGGCGTSSAVGLGGGLTIRLHADAVMFVPGATFKTNFRVVSGDGAPHTLYVVEPWPTAMTGCASAPSSVRGITFNTSGLSIDANSAMMIYTPGEIRNTNSSTSVRGQLYGCEVNLATSINLHYVAAGSTGGGAGRAFVVAENFRLDDQTLSLLP